MYNLYKKIKKLYDMSEINIVKQIYIKKKDKSIIG